MKYFFYSALYLIAQVSLSQVGPCPKGNFNFVSAELNGRTTLEYKDLSFKIIGDFSGERIDTVYQLVSGSDTLDRLGDKGIDNFEEILPFLGIPDWQLLLRVNKMYAGEKRKAEYKNLPRTYAKLSPHLFGVFGDKYALIKTSQGYNFINRKGTILFDCFFENATNFIEGKAVVKMDGKWYDLDEKGYLSAR